MTHHCKSSDKIIKHEIKDQQIESDCHELYDQIIITRYIVEKPNNKKLSEKMKKDDDIHIKNYSFFSNYSCEQSR